MSRLMEAPKRHIHDNLCSEVNNVIIALKLHSPEVARESTEQQNKIIEARKRHPMPDEEYLINLLERIRDEMNQCTEPYRRF